MFHEQTIEQTASELIMPLIDAKWLSNGFLTPLPYQEPDPNSLQRLLALLPTTIQSSGYLGHNSIFLSLSMKAFNFDPSLITRTRIDGLCNS
jgi:hypothetical protein